MPQVGFWSDRQIGYSSLSIVNIMILRGISLCISAEGFKLKKQNIREKWNEHSENDSCVGLCHGHGNQRNGAGAG
jgi:hypothetical protein